MLPEEEKQIADMELTSANCEKLLDLWRDALGRKEEARTDVKRENRETTDRNREVAKLETAVNDKRNVGVSDLVGESFKPENA